MAVHWKQNRFSTLNSRFRPNLGVESRSREELTAEKRSDGGRSDNGI